MNSVEQRLTAIGFRLDRQAAECWRVERAGPVRRRPAIPRCEPACSFALSVWLERLSDRRRPAAYRIRRIVRAG